MKKEDLFREIGEVDQDLVEEAADIKPQTGAGESETPEDDSKADKKSSGNILRIKIKKYSEVIGMVAACFVLVYIVGNSGLFSGGAKEAETTAASAQTTAAAAETMAGAAESGLEDQPEEAVPGEGMEETTAAETTAAAETTSAPISWGELSLPERYSEFIWNGITYQILDEGVGAEELGEKLADITLTKEYLGEIHTNQAEIWSLKEVEEEFVVAVLFDGCPTYFGAKNPSYGESGE